MLCPLELAIKDKSLKAEKIGEIQDAFKNLDKGKKKQYARSLDILSYKQFCQNLNSLFSLIRASGLVDINPKLLLPAPDEFIKDTIRDQNGKLELIAYNGDIPTETRDHKAKSFGKPIKA